ncbi:MAG: hypothetical protein GX640_02200 [Fibrobacter sp.]|nr:hypothetical protein [Fibrobacter sp.]
MKTFHILPREIRGKVKYVLDEDELRPRVEEFWALFEQNAKKIKNTMLGRENFNVVGFMDAAMSKIHPHLRYRIFYTSPVINLGIHSNGKVWMNPLVYGVFNMCPQLHNWCYHYLSCPLHFDWCEYTAHAMTGGTLSDIKFNAKLDKYNLINLTFIRKGYKKKPDEYDVLPEINIMLPYLVQEQFFLRWVKNVESTGEMPSVGPVYPVEKLSEVLNVLYQEAQSRMPTVPYHKMKKKPEWHVNKLVPVKDEPLIGRFDLHTVYTMIPDILFSYYDFVRFYSGRYSRFEELFCYLKVEKDDSVEVSNEKKERMLSELNQMLIENDVGMITGTGSGVYHSYIDFVLIDIVKGVRIIRRIVKKYKLPKRSWLLFLDAEKEGMWVNMYEDTPDPVMPDFEKIYR